MKTTLLPSILLGAALSCSSYAFADTNKEEWQNTVLSESTIKKVQEKKNDYKKCIGEQMQKPSYLEIDSRKATDEIIKLCEPALSKMRDVYLAEKVPSVIADRHLRQIRIQITRNVLESLMFAQATQKAGKP
ncbi:MAG: hypothetical protein IPN42_12845 [Methylococcaceae bacterium]|nr:hypothetical protein [Methylococcaceae bacterium]